MKAKQAKEREEARRDFEIKRNGDENVVLNNTEPKTGKDEIEF